MIPSPTTCPAKDVPAVRGTNEVLCLSAKAISFFKSSVSLGRATAVGISRYADASVAYSMRVFLSVYKSPLRAFFSSISLFCILHLIFHNVNVQTKKADEKSSAFAKIYMIY